MTVRKSKNELKTLFFNLNPRPGWTKDKTMLYFPLGLCNIASQAERAGYRFDILDLCDRDMTQKEVAAFLSKTEYDVIAGGGITHSYYLTKEFLELAQKLQPQALVVIGNSIASSIPELLLDKAGADVVVNGDGHETFVELLDCLAEGRDFSDVKGIWYKAAEKNIRTPERPVGSMDDKAFPMWDLFNVESYIESAKNYECRRHFDVAQTRPLPINTSKGCPYRCTFCANSYFHKSNPFRCHSPEYIVSEVRLMKEKFGIDYLWFWDELTFMNPAQSEALLRAMINADLNVKFSATCRIGMFNKETAYLAGLLREAGCVLINYSLESGSPVILKAMNKKISVPAFYEQKAILDDAGVPSAVNILLGYPQETEKTINETFKACYDNNVFPSAGYLLPLPGTPMFEYALENGFIGDIEKYILNMGERQFLNINMTQLPSERFELLVFENLKKIRDKMNLDITDEHLICSVVLKEYKASA